MLEWLRWFLGLKPKLKRLELRCVPYHEAGDLLHEGWTIAREEDRNRRIGWVYLERLESERKD